MTGCDVVLNGPPGPVTVKKTLYVPVALKVCDTIFPDAPPSVLSKSQVQVVAPIEVDPLKVAKNEPVLHEVVNFATGGGGVGVGVGRGVGLGVGRGVGLGVGRGVAGGGVITGEAVGDGEASMDGRRLGFMTGPIVTSGVGLGETLGSTATLVGTVDGDGLSEASAT